MHERAGLNLRGHGLVRTVHFPGASGRIVESPQTDRDQKVSTAASTVSHTRHAPGIRRQWQSRRTERPGECMGEECVLYAEVPVISEVARDAQQTDTIL